MLKKLLNYKGYFNILILIYLLWALVGFVLYPALKTLWVSVAIKDGISLINYKNILTSATSLTALKNTIVLGILTVIVCGTLGTTLAFFVNFFKLRFKSLIDKILLLPLALPGLIIVFSFVQLYGESGLITKAIEFVFNLNKTPFNFSGLGAILFIHAYTQYVYFYLNVSIGIKNLDQNLIEASSNLGASKLRVFTSIILPAITPSLIASSIITFMTAIGSFSAPSIVGGSYKVLTTQILLSKANNYMAIAAAQVVLLLIVSITYLGLARLYERKKLFANSVKATPIKLVKIKSGSINVFVHLILLFIMLMIVLPIITIFVLSFVKPGTWMIEIFPREFSVDNYLHIFSKARALKPIINSITMSILAAVFCFVVAIPSAYIIVKTRSKFKVLIEFLTMLPLAMPASAIAINMINAFNKPTIVTFNKILVGCYILLPIGYFINALPLMVRSSIISLQNVNENYLEASKVLGANRFMTFKRIVVPNIAPGITAGLLLIIIRSVGEYTTSVFIYNSSNKPISIAMANGIFEYQIGLAMAYGALVVTIAFMGSIIIKKLSAKN